MKKFLAVLLIAIVSCETVQDLDLESWWTKIRDKVVNTVKSVWDTLRDVVKSAVNWLKENGYFDLLKNKIIEMGKTAATAWCSNYVSAELCSNAVEGVVKLAGL